MKTRHLGRTGLVVSELCLGTMQFGWWADETASFTILDRYVEAGGIFIDTADIYDRGNAERILGRWLNARGNRDRLVIASKAGIGIGDGPNDAGGSRIHLLKAVEDSLRRLQTDYLDLYQIHYSDHGTPWEETLRTLDDLVRAGKVRYAGASNYRAAELIDALWAADRAGTVRYDSVQPHYNLIHRDEFERELDWVCRRYGLGVLPFSPLEYGFLTGKYRPDAPAESARARQVTTRVYNDRSWRILAEVEAIAADLESTPAAISIAWLMAQPAVTAPVLGARTVEQLDANLAAASIVLDADQIGRLNTVSAWPDSATRPPGTIPRPA